MAGAGIFRNGKWEIKVREAGGSGGTTKTKQNIVNKNNN